MGFAEPDLGLAEGKTRGLNPSYTLRPAFFLLFPADFLFFPADRLQIGFGNFFAPDSVLRWPTRALRPTAAALRPKAQRREGDGSYWVCSARRRKWLSRISMISFTLQCRLMFGSTGARCTVACRPPLQPDVLAPPVFFIASIVLRIVFSIASHCSCAGGFSLVVARACIVIGVDFPLQIDCILL
jgi:hypothetical protein